ncbi:hypothetical protein M3Y94_00450600 [Aphelenchoides besseyi]|nr:hypothetical protein M3Y94_00450600 [Aphelenchoides besseyi]
MGNVQQQHFVAQPKRAILIERHADQRLPYQLFVRLQSARMSLIKVPTVVRHESTASPTSDYLNHTPQRHSPSLHKSKPTIRATWEFLSKWLIYGMVLLFLALNTYALLNRVDTIFYLRIYQLVIACIMVATSGIMIEFLFYAKRNLPKLNAPHSIPRPMLVSSLILTVGIVLGYAYFIIFNLTFQDCDTLVDALNPSEIYLEIAYEIAMIWFCSVSFIYLLQRGYYGAVSRHSDKLRRLWINATVCIAWIQVVVYKGYLSHQVLCQRHELSGLWCPVDARTYTCVASETLEGTRQIWYYLNKGLLNSTVIACASEFFPVVLVAHWLVCGGAEERADHLILKQRIKQKKKSVRRVLQRFMADMSRIYGAKHKHVSLPPLRTAATFAYILSTISCISIVVVVVHWFVKFYYTILFDKLFKDKWIVDDCVQFASGIMQIFLHLTLYFWATRIEERRFDAHHKAEARGDVVLILGCCSLLTVKFILQFVELVFQATNYFISPLSCILRNISLLTIISAEWLQFFSLRRILALSDRDVNSSRSFLPICAIAAFFANCASFGVTFFETTTMKYQIAHEKEYGFSKVTLMSMIITQTIYPADYLFNFTTAGCWMDLIYRYSRMGYFEMGKPLLDHADFDNHSILSATTVSRRPTTRTEHRLSLPTISVNEAK